MTLRKIVYIPHNYQLIISLPKRFRNKRRVLVTIDELPDSNTKKIELIRKASRDPLFIADLEEVNNDFEPFDGETL